MNKIRAKLSAATSILGAGLQRLSFWIYTTRQQQQSRIFLSRNGDKTLRLDYELGADSIVVDLGGYEGQWASDIYAKFNCTIHVFEPVAAFADQIEQRFIRNDSIVLHRCGLAARTEKAEISLDHNRSSTFKKGRGPSVRIALRRADDFFAEHKIAFVHLMKINIEGGEYDLLEHLITSGFIANIRDLQIQFHDFVAGAQERMIAIQANLSRTHRPTYQYPFVWENWTLKP